MCFMFLYLLKHVKRVKNLSSGIPSTLSLYLFWCMTRNSPSLSCFRKKHGAFIVFYFPEVKSKAARGIVGCVSLLQLTFFPLLDFLQTAGVTPSQTTG